MTAPTDPALDPLRAKLAELRATHRVRVCAVPVEGGAAYFRQPTPDEHDEWRSLAAAGDDSTTRKAFRAYVQACYLGALVGGEWLPPASWAEVSGREGPGWTSGPAGDAVNTIAGSKARGAALFS